MLLSRLTGDDNISVGTGCSGQLPFVLRAAVDPNEGFSTLLARIEEVPNMPHDCTQASYLTSLLAFLRIFIRRYVVGGSTEVH